MSFKVLNLLNTDGGLTSTSLLNEQHAASGDHRLCQSESGVELKSLLKLIDKEIQESPATDEDDDLQETLRSTVLEDSNPFFAQKTFTRNTARTSNNEEEPKVTLSETLIVPVKKYPKYNFVGRILGPRGMTVKQLEKETGCKIFVRGRASSTTFNPHTKATTRMCPLNGNSKPTLSTISQDALTDDPLHVFIECQDYPGIAEKKLAHAVQIISELLSPPADGKDELKRQQLVDISLINGTYRATSSSTDVLLSAGQFRRSSPWSQTVDPTVNPGDLELKPLKLELSEMTGHGDLGSVYGIAQQKRIWQKPRGPDTSSDEYAKSVSSREYVTDIVNKTKKSPVTQTSDESLFNLPQSVVTETLKVAKSLLASHKHMSFRAQSDHVSAEIPKLASKGTNFGAGDGGNRCAKSEMPPPLMSGSLQRVPPSDFFNHPNSPSANQYFQDFPPIPFYMLPPPAMFSRRF
ncbi:unnamed protein product [Caenorhabditis sp. 36 PRJEB53466]|nr:unnamed protein product [Caenorhabditis sp. 36 PRJEB53466]